MLGKAFRLQGSGGRLPEPCRFRTERLRARLYGRFVVPKRQNGEATKRQEHLNSTILPRYLNPEL